MSDRDRPRREPVLAILRAYAPALRAFGLTDLTLFGSVARDSARAVGSDVDVMATVADPSKLDLKTLVTIQEQLSSATGWPTNLVLLNVGEVPVVFARLCPSLLANSAPDRITI
jgi:predicted nucleotidyltransferase